MELILTHGNTEFDGFASQLAAARLFPGAYPVLSQSLNRNVRDYYALYRPDLPHVPETGLPNEPVTRVILVDTQRLPRIGPITRSQGRFKVDVYDHHPKSESLDPSFNFIGGEVGSATTILTERLVTEGYEPTPIEATLLLLGIYEDTGSLTYLGTTARDAHCVAWLLENGASLAVAAEYLNRPLTPGQRKVYDELTETAQIIDIEGHRVLIATARPGEHVDEVSVLAHKFDDLFDPDAVFILVQMNHHVQLIARSAVESLDVGEVLSHFGGGGHPRAAAAVVQDGDLGSAKRRLLDLLPYSAKAEAKAERVMTKPVQVAFEDARLSDAIAAFSEISHRALPVVDEAGLVTGILYRDDLSRAAKKRFPTGTISSIMKRQFMFVSPRTSLHQVRQLILDYDLEYLPVVESGKVAGIIAREDLLRDWPGKLSRERPEAEIMRQVEAALPAFLVNAVFRAADLADDTGASVYLVGGFVRDLLLNIPNYDVDMVVEGNAIELARQLGKELGARVKSHKRFGTAKLVFEDEKSRVHLAGNGRREALLESGDSKVQIDFATARREFYEASSALPAVEASCIMHDLYRRDFTINTMAISLDRSHRGRLIDFFGGREDLKQKIIRVLHDRSFIDDPTRILRAVRLEQRLGFCIEEESLALIRQAVAERLLDKVSGDRIRLELFLIFREPDPTPALARLAELGVLQSLCDSFSWEDGMSEKSRRLARYFSAERRPSAYLSVLVSEVGEEAAECFADRLRLSPQARRGIEETLCLKRILERLGESCIKPSEITDLLENVSPVVLETAVIAEEPGRATKAIEKYLADLRFVKPELGGSYLRKLGITPGPIYREILSQLKHAKLDGVVKRKEDEEKFVQQLIAGMS